MNQATRLFDYIDRQLELFPLEKSFGQRKDDTWSWFSTKEMVYISRQLAAGLHDLGLQKGDKVGIVSYKNRPEWYLVDLACQYLGLISVPLYPTISSREYEYILNDSEVKVCFVGGRDLWDKVTTAKANVPSLQQIYTFDKNSNRPHYNSLLSERAIDFVLATKDTITENDVVTIIYTSGTTGTPKGVVLTHLNINWAVRETLVGFPLEKGYRVISFLPFCHIFERACIYGYTDKCVSVHCTGTDNLGGPDGDLVGVKPHMFTTVPRLLEKVYEKIVQKGEALSGIKKSLFFWALSLTKDYEHEVAITGINALKKKIADKLIFSKWREALGGDIQCIISGAAPCPTKIIKVFSYANVPIMEGYGLTETSPTLAINRYKGTSMVGTVGPVLNGVEIIIDRSEGDYNNEEGEILAKGPNIMQGYYNKPEKTAEVFKEINGEKYFRTGDIGKFVKSPAGGDYLKITDRKKELLKTSGGKYVAPAPIESKLKENFIIEQAMVIGDKQKFVSALIVPSKDLLKEWCKQHNVTFTSLDEVLKNETVIAAFQKCVDKTNRNFSHVEQIKKFSLLPTTWEAIHPNGEIAELTPTMKLKRRVIREKFSAQINEIYA